MQHLATQITNPGDQMFRPAGQTVWAGHGEAGELGLAWDWVLIGRGVVAMADPMAIVSNLRLLGESGQALDSIASARHFNDIVHGLPWQRAVAQTLEAGLLQ